MQDPTKVDKIAKVDKSLHETKEVLTKTIDAVLARGEKLDDLVDRSAELSASSKMFYKTAAKTNSVCCKYMYFFIFHIYIFYSFSFLFPFFSAVLSLKIYINIGV